MACPSTCRKVTTPAYILSTSEDHIAPWRTTYATTGLFSGPVRFVLGASGHIAGVINPPDRNKYGYWTNTTHPEDPDAWLPTPTEHEGSWWPDWMRWLKRHGGGSGAGANAWRRRPEAHRGRAGLLCQGTHR